VPPPTRQPPPRSGRTEGRSRTDGTAHRIGAAHRTQAAAHQAADRKPLGALRVAFVFFAWPITRLWKSAARLAILEVGRLTGGARPPEPEDASWVHLTSASTSYSRDGLPRGWRSLRELGRRRLSHLSSHPGSQTGRMLGKPASWRLVRLAHVLSAPMLRSYAF